MNEVKIVFSKHQDTHDLIFLGISRPEDIPFGKELKIGRWEKDGDFHYLFIPIETEITDLKATPEVEHDEEFWSPPFEPPDPLDSYRDYLETMADEVAATRS